EMKTKPTQASVKELQGMGIQPDIIVCRSEYPLDDAMRNKISLFCNLPADHVLQNLDVEYLYVSMNEDAFDKEKIRHHVQLCDTATHKVFYDKLEYIYSENRYTHIDFPASYKPFYRIHKPGS
ncbi:protein containing CTP synthase, partial [human gut metagenome]